MKNSWGGTYIPGGLKEENSDGRVPVHVRRRDSCTAPPRDHQAGLTGLQVRVYKFTGSQVQGLEGEAGEAVVGGQEEARWRVLSFPTSCLSCQCASFFPSFFNIF